MHFTTLLAVASACLSTAVSAQYTNRSYAFNLVLESSVNKTLNGARLTACHTGAAIESLCTFPSAANSASQQFYYNYTKTDSGTSGILTWNLNANGGALIVSEPMTFSYNPSSNVALPLFFPSEDNEVTITFDKNNYLNVLSFIDDTVSPPVYKQQALSRWQVCTTNYGGYTYQNLNWVLGTGKPQNPSCQAVKVKRTAIPK